ncbi:hypothetical protein QOT17_025447 [Balamuthia mandrillaris]
MKEVDPAVGHIKLEVAKAAVEVDGVIMLAQHFPMITMHIQTNLCNEPWMPPIDKLVALKDVIDIPDSCWPMVMLTFNLAKGASLYYVKKRIKELNATMNVEKTEGGRGHLFPFKEFMERVIKENINKPPTSGIVKVKLSLDGSTAAARGHRQMELGTLETLHDEWSLKALKSSHNCRPWLMYLGKEDSSTLEAELGSQLNVINEIAMKGSTLTIEAEEVNIELFLTVDLKALKVLSGLNSFYSSKATYCCFWCLATRQEIGDRNLKEETISFRTVEKVINKLPTRKKKRAKEFLEQLKRTEPNNINYENPGMVVWEVIKNLQQSTREKSACNHAGHINKPLLLFPPTRVVPDLLHLVMGVVRKLLMKTAELVTENDDELHLQILNKLIEMAIYIVDIEEKRKEIEDKRKKKKRNNQTKIELAQQLKRSHLNRAEYLHILQHHKEILDLFQSTEKEANKTLQNIYKAWWEFHRLCTLALQEGIIIIEEQWKKEAKKFKDAYLDAFAPEDFTTYMHVFVDHLGYFLEKYGCVEMFSNFGIEHTHSRVKRTIRQRTSGFRGINTGTCDVTKDVLTTVHRTQTISSTHPEAAKAHKAYHQQESWADKNLVKFPELMMYLKREQKGKEKEE